MTGFERRLSRRWALAALAALLLLAPGSPAAAVDTGDRAPAFALPALEGGGRLDLKQYRGKVVWLDFWASWCPPCLTSLPELEKLRRQMPAEDFQILAINVDKDPKKALRFLEKNPVGYPSASDPDGALPERFGLKTMPTSYLIDRDGTVRLVHEGYRSGDIDSIRREITRLIEARR
jgi:peroxiredoxin